MKDNETESYSELDELMSHQESYVESEIGEILFALREEFEDV